MSERHALYTSRDWRDFREAIISERLARDGEVICEYCGKPIVKPCDIVLHHPHMITDENYQDANVALNQDNIMVVHAQCHSEIHSDIGKVYDKPAEKLAYLVYGPPCAGKSTYVDDVKHKGDLVVDVNAIWLAISGELQVSTVKPIVFKIRDVLYDAVEHRTGTWRVAWIIGGYPLRIQREDLCRRLGAEPLFVDADEQTCIDRAMADPARGEKHVEYIKNWFRQQ